MAPRTLGDAVRRTGGAVSVGDDVTAVVLARALAHHGVDAAAVLTQSGTLAGIATGTDLAKLIARRDTPETPVAHFMIQHPTMLAATETPANAIALMRAGGFRHLPVVDPESGAVLGIVDVLQLAYDAILRLQSAYTMVPTRRAFTFLRAARDTFEKPTVRSFLSNAPSNFATITAGATVQNACDIILQKHVAAIIVVDAESRLEGIFTCRDIASRVIAKNRNPETTLLGEVMTPRPDFALPDYTILECLQRMQACGFRHLPVIDEKTRVVIGLVDVLQLASDALLGITDPRTAQEPSVPAPHGAGFGYVLSSLFTSGWNENGSQASSVSSSSQPQPPTPSLRALAATPLRSATGARQVSHLNASDLARVRHGGHPSGRPVESASSSNSAPLPPFSENMGANVTFKFKDRDGEYRRVKTTGAVVHGSFDQLVLDVRKRYFSNGANVSPLRIKYVDEEGDAVVIANDDDLEECLNYCNEHGWKTVKLKVAEMNARPERPSVHSDPSPVSSRASSYHGSPKRDSVKSSSSAAVTFSNMSDLAPRPEAPTLGSPSSGMASPNLPGSPSTELAVEAQSLLIEDVSQAITKYNEALEINGKNCRALAGRGAAKLMSADPAGAELDYRQALEYLEGGVDGSGVSSNVYDMSVVGLVETLIEQRRYEEVHDVAVKLDGRPSKHGCVDALRDELTASATAASEALSEGLTGDAMALFTNAIRIESAMIALADGREAKSASLRNGRAKCYLALGDFAMAYEDFEAAANLDAESVAAFKGCGKCLVELGEPEKALVAYRKAEKLDAGDEEVRGQITTLAKCLPDPVEERKESIAKLGALLGGMNLPGRNNPTVDSATAIPSSDADKPHEGESLNESITTGESSLSGRPPSGSTRRRKKRTGRRRTKG